LCVGKLKTLTDLQAKLEAEKKKTEKQKAAQKRKSGDEEKDEEAAGLNGQADELETDSVSWKANKLNYKSLNVENPLHRPLSHHGSVHRAILPQRRAGLLGQVAWEKHLGVCPRWLN